MKTINAPHELDKLFDVKPGQTEIHIPGSPDTEVTDLAVIEGELVTSPTPGAPEQTAVESYDHKDDVIEGDLTEIQQKAIEAYESMIVAAQTVTDKKYAPANAEVAASFLSIALNAVKEKNSTKSRKDKIVAAKKTPVNRTVTNTQNNIVTDRETARRLMRERDDE